MNRKHVSKVGKYIGMACLLFVCAMVQSCRDEYFYDDQEPDFLGSSIYDYLKEQGNFTHFLKVIDELDYDEVLSRTGSKTLFVADDDPLIFYREIAHAAKNMLSTGGSLLFEIHELLAEQTLQMLQAEGFEATLRHDFLSKPRMICCQKRV